MPVIRLMSVVLPAPLGPDQRIAHAMGMTRLMSLATTSEPKRLSRPCVDSAGGAHDDPPRQRRAELRQAAENAVRQQHHHGDEQRADPEVPVLRR